MNPPEGASPVYGWLRLDARGGWWLRGERVHRRSIIDSLQRHYQPDGAGRWFCRLGWQQVYVRLDRLPLILSADSEGGLRCHRGRPVQPRAVFLDADGALLLDTDQGPGQLHDADLLWAAAQMHGLPTLDTALAEALAQPTGAVTGLRWQGRLRVQRLDADQAPAQLGFDPDPRPGRSAPV